MISQPSANSSPINYNVLPHNIAFIPKTTYKTPNYDNHYNDMLIYGSAESEDEEDILMHFNYRQQPKIGYHSGESNIRNWKSLINPEINHYYNKIIKAKSEREEQKQFCTPNLRPNTSSSKHQSEYSPSPKSINHQNEINNKVSLGNDITKNTRNNISENQNEQEKEECEVDLVKQKYENKISVLEHQNSNLKDELFYLRAAILAKYEERLGDSGMRRNLG